MKRHASSASPKDSPRRPPFKLSLRITFGEDIGQNFGTLFEAKDADGEPVLGAGFLGAYNTHERSDRYVVHFFARTDADAPLIESLPRPTTDCGVYLADLDGRLLARSIYGGKDMVRRFWDPQAKAWRQDDSNATARMRLAGRLLEFRTNEVRYDGKPLLQWSGPGRIEPFYYANGWLVMRQHFPEDERRNGRLIAVRWMPQDKGAIDPTKGRILELPTPRAFPYACGSLGNELLITTNIGQVHRLNADGWQTLRETDGKSYQVYAALNTQDRLWLGQYPTGNLFDYFDGKLMPLNDQPPPMPGVSTSARELQTLTIYRGDIYAGVWPWGEVWRYRPGSRRWEFVKRFFTHPEPTDATVHPYEKETAALDPVANLWGQRIASMVPLGDSLYISTSAKGTPAYDPKFKFLADDKWKEYGMVYRYRLPGHLSVPMEWKDRTTQLEFIIEKGWMRVRQDGKELGRASLNGAALPTLTKDRLTWGSGLYGQFAGKMMSKRVEGL
ncbi:MAG: hypothetical protein NZT92_08095 [Abditibacteriales bacterium]|nr:hypothetical protein [Abditibacteriales bacterium]MDW8367181.1 hypothetical protein [Abditibacteriales bacterium]